MGQPADDDARALVAPRRKHRGAGSPGVGRSVAASVLAGFAACLLAVGLLIAWVTAATFDRERIRAEDGLTALAASEGTDLGSLFDSSIPLITDLATNPALADLDPRTCAQTFAPLSSVRSAARLVVVDGDGETVCSLADAPGEIAPVETFAAVLARGETVADREVFIDPVSGHPAVAVAAPVPGPDGPVGAVVGILFTDVPAMDLPPGVDDETVMLTIDPASGLVAGATTGAPYAPGMPVEWTDPPGVDVDGVRRIWREVVDPATGWRVLVGLDEDVAMAAARDQRQSLLSFGAAVVGLVAALALALHRRLVRPIRRLGSAIAAAPPGGGARRAPESGPTEVVEVARAFNDLVESHDGLVERLRHNAFHDPLTGLLNRRGATTELTRLLEDPAAAPLVVLFIDLDRFKLVNDSHGHAVGDRLLVELTERIKAAVPAHWVISRFGGDEFVILCPATPDPRPTVEVLSEVLRGTIRIDGMDLRVGGSTGIARAHCGMNGDDLIRQADTAMYRAKDDGRGGWAEFDSHMQALALERLRIEADLRGAAARGELVLHYQPLVNLTTGCATGVEALIRWQHPARGLLQPAAFLPIAEDTDLIFEVGTWVAHEAARRTAAWRAAGTPTRVSINVSAAELLRTDVVRTIAGAVEAAGAEPRDLVVEVTESAILTDIESTVVQLEALRALGVGVALDDFGTGFSSLSHLRQLPADEIKIDRTFIAELGHNPVCDAIVTSVITLAHAIDLVVVGEGIETEEQRAHLARLGCDRGQGYLLGRPASYAVPVA
ncbi:putative bifunctional diguanylate cyclase/phosphodiesterase [Nocardioides stalactiti]|uniref:putative bifunctional diguanylate cyclase/phosphodiesterase n=1 Tax=Nocardioides stalactiti TaxID=2755356 RepID=UPI0016027E93|nr:EAL domain-containing protein [Nocardioides stalactiti]